ncbi:MAG: siderophore-interacting protein [Bacteroidota bacterium]
MLRVKEKNQVSLNMLRITLEGEQLDNISWKPGCYIKLSIPSGEKRKMRTYTVRSYDSTRKTLDVDFAIHQPAGPATRWALDAKIGDVIDIRGPGHLKMDITKGDWYLFAADMAALPAAISAIEALPSGAKGYAFLEVTDEQDKQEFSYPSGLQIQWLLHPNPKEKSDQQLNAIQSLEPLEGIPNIFVAGELSTIREIKAYIKGEARFKNAYTYISSYWKIGASEEKHKLAKMMMR